MSQRSERFVALLRGINVGGNNIIPKDALRRCFEELGFTQVRTYIRSGNILFRVAEGETEQLISTPNPCCSTKSRWRRHRAR